MASTSDVWRGDQEARCLQRHFAGRSVLVVAAHLGFGEGVRTVLVVRHEVGSSDPDQGKPDGVQDPFRHVRRRQLFLAVQRPNVGDADRDVQEERGQEAGAVLVASQAGNTSPWPPACIIPKIAGARPSHFFLGNRIGAM